jgi:Glutathione S-transferase, N-terminal domain
MAVKLHRCSTMWVKISGHPCWRVQKALDDAGIEYEVIKHPVSRSKRTEYIELTGQKLYPAIQLEDGTVIRKESKEMAEMIRSGQLTQGAASSGAAEAPS